MGAAIFLAIMALDWCYRFHPRNVMEAMDPIGNSNRVFTEVGGFTDICVDLYASDWPWTFGKPAYLGDFYWPQVQKSSGAYWSSDGSVIAFQTHRHENAVLMFCSAYDYRKHKLIKPDYVVEGPVECDLHIASLLKARGGLGQPENRLGDFKGELSSAFPAWGWIAPTVFLVGGFMIARRLRRRR